MGRVRAGVLKGVGDKIPASLKNPFENVDELGNFENPRGISTLDVKQMSYIWRFWYLRFSPSRVRVYP